MGVLIWGLMIIFIILISYQVFLAHFLDISHYNSNHNNYTIVEGLTTTSSTFQEYADTETTDALELAQQNQDNILFLRGQIKDMSGNIVSLAKQITQIVKAQQDSANEVAPSSPPTVEGTLD